MTDRFYVLGKPEPKGSTRSFVVKGRAVTTSDNPNLKDWQGRVATEAQNAGVTCHDKGTAVQVEVFFRLTKPKSYPKRVEMPVTKPDIDKIGRAVLDGLTGIAFKDDSQVVVLTLMKAYAAEGEPPGAWVEISEVVQVKVG